MQPQDARALIGAAVAGAGPVWADVGAGDGTFTRALVELLGPDARVLAVDRDEDALRSLADWARGAGARVTTVAADFTGDFELPGVGERALDGMLLANALHFVPDQERVLGRLVERVRPGGRVVLVEYDGRAPSPWVPHPIPAARVPELAASAGLVGAAVLATRPSAYRGTLYVAAASRKS